MNRPTAPREQILEFIAEFAGDVNPRPSTLDLSESWCPDARLTRLPKANAEPARQAARRLRRRCAAGVNNAAGDGKRFETLYEEYRRAPLVTRKRIYLETLAEIMPKLGRKVILDEDARGVLPLLQLDGERKEVKP